MRLPTKNANVPGTLLPEKLGSFLPIWRRLGFSATFSDWHVDCYLNPGNYKFESTQWLGTLGVVDEIARKSVWHS